VRNEKQDLARLSKKTFKRTSQLKPVRNQQAADLADMYNEDSSPIIGNSPMMRRVAEITSRIVLKNWEVLLIHGESGTGKELIARTIHAKSDQQPKSFINMYCTGLSAEQLECELFGCRETDVENTGKIKNGAIELANEGTIYIDEIGEMNGFIQAKLLKAIEHKLIRRVGGSEDVPVKSRIISATNHDLGNLVEEGKLRKDLYYQLSVISIYLPPLRKRGDDILKLAYHFLNRYASKYNSPVCGFSAKAEALLRSYTWPGNVTELSNTVERLVFLEEADEITRALLERALESEPLSRKQTMESVTKIDIPPGGMSLDEGEKHIIYAALANNNWNKRIASQILGISRPRLDRKIKKYGLLLNR